MVLTDFFRNIFMETQISHVKCFKQSLIISIIKKKNGCGFWAKIGVKITLYFWLWNATQETKASISQPNWMIFQKNKKFL